MTNGAPPGTEILQALAQAPIDLMNLGIRHIGELNATFGLGVQRLAAGLAVPPLPPMAQGLPSLPSLPQGLPSLPAPPGAASQAPATAASMGFGTEFTAVPRILI